MTNVVQILIEGKDQFSGPAGMVQRSAKGLRGGMASLGRAVRGDRRERSTGNE